ncbi:MAG TPA: tRNA uridine-5-carboxymethylaminomethyl(34) synthesis GTPase MnmE [Peptococcaceae bacterium]|nr:MAG: tRNA modification GTPase MnmE [Clostridia bacterium 41_269]HBT19797.1 tRNA uridine-5-carboxymethylaminomethyl(34) synthesis GTPase MnmE [Peptococcaceae bacterium]
MEFDTIAAISTPLGEGGIGIVRISGPDAVKIAKKIFKPKGRESIGEVKSHTLTLGYVVCPNTGEVIDEVLLSVMKSPRSYTREDVVEINCHGGMMPLKRTLEAVLDAGARLAEPGEFTKRAFLNGRIDLAQAEAVIDIIRAKTDESLKVAVGNLEGSLSKEIKKFMDGITDILARIEANIDFPEEDPEAFITKNELEEMILKMMKEIEGFLQEAGKGKILREGLKAVIAGKPNVGKSSLLNALLKEKRAIVTEIPGTTRDIIEEMLNIGGIPVRIIDTAGIRKSRDKVERIGVRRSEKSIEEADLVLLVLDATTGIEREDEIIIEKVKNKECIVLINKIDITGKVNIPYYEKITGKECIAISAKKGIGLREVEGKIRERVFEGKINTTRPLITRVRHEQALKKALKSLGEGLAACRDNLPLDVVAIDIREAWEALGEITGDKVDEEILNRIFEEFCIGK